MNTAASPEKGNLQTLLERGEFVITAEITPKLTASPEDIVRQAAPLKGLADAVNVTDGAGARVAMSSLVASALLVKEGIEPVMQMTCRDRNRIAIAADLIGASALGIRNLLALSGDDPKGGDEPEAKAVFDLGSKDIMTLSRRLSDDGQTTSGRSLATPASLFVGAADAPFDPPADWEPTGLLEKIAAGTQFVQTQFCYEPEVLKRYLTRLEDYGVLEKTSMIIGIGPIASAKSARWMDENLYGVSIPTATIKRLEDAEDQAAEGLKIGMELIQAYRDMPGVRGVHVMSPAQGASRTAEVIKASGVLERRSA
ncbi:MAG: methylenetetrahydrofolate reductase [Cellvibrionales bacterium]|jgi:methylenetetrahydrofolate reductase (NADPH)